MHDRTIHVSQHPAFEMLEARTLLSAITEFSWGVTASSSPHSIVAGPDGNVWFTEGMGNRIGRITPTGEITEFSAGLTPNSYPDSITNGPDGNLWFIEIMGNRIGRITPAGDITEFGNLGFHSSMNGITAGPDGNLWFTEYGRIGRFNLDTGEITEYSAGLSPNGYPTAITAGPDGNLWFTEEFGNQIGRINPSTGQIDEFANGISSYSQPTDIAAGPDGSLWFTENMSNRIGRITTDGVVTEFSTGSQFSGPNGIAADADGNFWFTGMVGGVGRITPDGEVTQYSNGLTPNRLMSHIVAGADGNVWFTEGGLGDAIGRVNLADWLDLSVTQTAPAAVVADSTVGNLSFVTTVTNTGPADATEVTVAGMLTALPAGVVLVTAIPSAGTFDAGMGTWTIGTLAAGEQATLTVTLTATTAVAAGTQIMQTATVSSDQVDADPSNDTATAVVTTIPQTLAALMVTIDQAGGQRDLTHIGPVNFTVVFSSPVTDFGNGDVTFSGTAPGTLVGQVTDSGDGMVYNVAVSGMTGSGTVVATVGAGVAHDAGGQPNLDSVSLDNSITYDVTAPTVTINQAAGQVDPSGDSPVNFTVHFSEPVKGFGADDLRFKGTAPGKLRAIVTGSGTTYNVAVSGMSNTGTIIATVRPGAARDAAGNASFASGSTDNTITYNAIGVPVTVVKAVTQVDPTCVLPVNFTVQFAQPMTGFTASDVVLGGTAPGVLAAVVTGSGTTYNVAVSGATGNGTVSVAIPAGVASDSNGHTNFASNGATKVKYDKTAPTVKINQSSDQTDPTRESPIEFTVEFSEPVVGFDTGDVILGGTAPGTLIGVVENSGDNETYTVSVAGMTGSGTITVSIPVGAAYDLAGNASRPSTSTDSSVTYDITPPTVTINQASGQEDPTRGSIIHFTAVFSEPVTDFTKSAVTLGGTSAGATVLLATDSGNHKTFDIVVTGMSKSGTVTASIPAGKSHDAAGNGSKASTSTDNSVEFKAPTVTVTEFSAGIPAGRSIGLIVQGSDGNLWFTFTEMGSGYGVGTIVAGIGKITPQGVVSDVYVDRVSDYPTIIAGHQAHSNPMITGFTKGPDGNVWFTETWIEPRLVDHPGLYGITLTALELTGAGCIGRITPQGQVAKYPVSLDPYLSTRLSWGIASGPDGNLWFPAEFGLTVNYGEREPLYDVLPHGWEAPYRITPQGQMSPITEGVEPTWNGWDELDTYKLQFQYPTVALDGNLWSISLERESIGGIGISGISRITPAGQISDFHYIGSGFNDNGILGGLALGADGNLWYTEQTGNQFAPTWAPAIVRMTPQGQATGFSTGLSPGSVPGLLVAGPEKSLWFLDTSDSTNRPGMVGRITTDGTITEYPVGATSGWDPTSLTAGPNNTLWFTECDLASGTSRICRVNIDLEMVNVTVIKAAGQVSPTKDAPVNFKVSFDEAVDDFAAGDVVMGGTAPGPRTAVVTDSGDHKTYNVAVSGMTGDGTVVLTVPAGVAHNSDGAANAASSKPDNSVVYNKTRPTVTINQAVDQADPTATGPIKFTVVFSKPVIDFTKASVQLLGTALGKKVSSVTGSKDKMTYTVVVSGMTTSGTVIPVIAAGTVHDAAKNGNFDSTSTDNTVVFDGGPNHAPTGITLSGKGSIAENLPAGTVVGTFTATDPDKGDTFTYSLVDQPGSTDNDSFQIVGNALQTNAKLNFESKNSYAILVRVTDLGGQTFDKQFRIAVNDANDAPTNLALSAASIPENAPAKTTVGTFSSADQDFGDTCKYTLVKGEGGEDNGSFKISGLSLTTRKPLDYEAKNTYNIRVRATDKKGKSVEKAFTITVTDVNEAPVVMAGTFTLPENSANGTALGTIAGVDPDTGQIVSWWLAGGNTNSAFAIDPFSGQLIVANAAALDFETTPVFTLIVAATDDCSTPSPLTGTATMTIKLTDVNEAPKGINLSADSVAENKPKGTIVGKLSALDPDAKDSFRYSLVSGAGDDDNGFFSLSGTLLKTNSPFDFEAKNSYSILVRVTDKGGLSYDQQFTIGVTDIIEPQVLQNISKSTASRAAVRDTAARSDGLFQDTCGGPLRQARTESWPALDTPILSWMAPWAIFGKSL